MTALWTEAGALQRPLPDGSLSTVARGVMKDEGGLDVMLLETGSGHFVGNG